ncbi:MAG TPA: zinc ribbon domain-containing protein [Pyrinomonadaceae bacterium]|nr:zinc ribbon domain-containing protein [Pyrinomonadaceae bacterium]
MYCQNCGSGLNPQTRYCNRCGTHLVPAGEKRLEKTAAEKRLDEYLDGLFWISVIGLAFILGGAILLKKVNFSDVVILVYVVLSSTVFLINFGFSLWGTLNLMRSSKEGKLTMQPGHDTRELIPPKIEPVMMPTTSVTESTTRSLKVE